MYKCHKRYNQIILCCYKDLNVCVTYQIFVLKKNTSFQQLSKVVRQRKTRFDSVYRAEQNSTRVKVITYFCPILLSCVSISAIFVTHACTSIGIHEDVKVICLYLLLYSIALDTLLRSPPWYTFYAMSFFHKRSEFTTTCASVDVTYWKNLSCSCLISAALV